MGIKHLRALQKEKGIKSFSEVLLIAALNVNLMAQLQN
jgi:hypothetical protein